MITWIQKSWKNLISRQKDEQALDEISSELPATSLIDLDLAPDDSLIPYLLNVSGVIEVEKLNLDSPALHQLKEAGVKMMVPLVSQGELIGLLNLGPRRSEQDYSADDRRLLTTLATQAAPALRVAQLVRQQKAEARERERLEQELKVARVIQQTLLPQDIPLLQGWQLTAHWQPAREVSGDFYDFVELADGRLGVLVADVTDKGVPAALVMATSRSILRSAAERFTAPGDVLARANDLLHPDIPAKMFVTCLYLVLDRQTGHIQYANAGHNLPYRIGPHGVEALRVRGMPLGLMPGMDYEQKEITLLSGETLLLTSDGLVEAHNPSGEMFGFPRLQSLAGNHSPSQDLIKDMLAHLSEFTGPGWVQEDDVTLVTIQRLANPKDKRLLATFTIQSKQGNERLAIEKVSGALAGLALPKARLDRLKTAVGEATMNAMEHGNQYQEQLPVELEVWRSREAVHVKISDSGGSGPIKPADQPDIEAKLDGLQTPRGWGMFLIKNMVDDLVITTEEGKHILELVMKVEGAQNG